MAQLSVRDICDARFQLYQAGRESHLSSSIAPNGQAHEVDVLKLLCLSECTDYGLSCAQARGPDGVVATAPILAGDIVTFFPGDSVAYWPDTAADVSMRIASDRVRERISEYCPRDNKYSLDLGQGFRITGHPDFAYDPNYLGHLVHCKQPANCRIDQCHGIAVALVATCDIQQGDDLALASRVSA